MQKLSGIHSIVERILSLVPGEKKVKILVIIKKSDEIME